MKKIYTSQTELTIRLITGIDLSQASSVEIQYKKPGDDTILSWTAAIEDTAYGVISYTIQSESELNEVGTWKFWAFVEFTNGKKARGETVTYHIYDEES